MLVKQLAINDKTRENLRKLVKPFFEVKQGTELNNVISEILSDKDLFLYMATCSKDSGIILGRMNYFDDIKVEVPYGIMYDFENPSLNLFTFESFGQPKKPIKTLRSLKVLPVKKSMGIDTAEHYSNYPTVESFVNSLNTILQRKVKDQKGFWVDFNKPFYR